MKNIALFASGSGTNAENVINYFKSSDKGKVALLLSNKQNAFALKRADKHSVPTHVFSREEFYQSNTVLDLLKSYEIDFIALVGFLWLFPQNIIKAYPGKVINIHPALLPKYGGKGMYGHHVHQAVSESGDRESGITIHYVNEKYDEGNIILQAKCPIEPGEAPGSIAQKVHELEYQHLPKVMEDLL